MTIADLLPISSDVPLAERFATTIPLTARSKDVAITSALGAEEKMQRRMTMPIERNKNELKLYYAVKNEDGTYGEFQLLEKCKTIDNDNLDGKGEYR